MKIADLRQEYMRAGLSEADAHPNPLRQFEHWFRDALAAGLPLPNAMTLATAKESGAPSARIVLLKDVEEESFVFYTNYQSAKGRELAARPEASLVFLWSELERQVRVEGRVERVSAQASDEYYASRPLGARLSAWASAQSDRVRDRRALEDALAAMSARFGEHPPRPAHWGGYRVIPAAVEFWQGRANRLHDRLLYTPADGGWKIERLAP
jgi:pyridoxamine 5'-phosphate oxidase